MVFKDYSTKKTRMKKGVRKGNKTREEYHQVFLNILVDEDIMGTEKIAGILAAMADVMIDCRESLEEMNRRLAVKK